MADIYLLRRSNKMADSCPLRSSNKMADKVPLRSSNKMADLPSVPDWILPWSQIAVISGPDQGKTNILIRVLFIDFI